MISIFHCLERSFSARVSFSLNQHFDNFSDLRVCFVKLKLPALWCVELLLDAAVKPNDKDTLRIVLRYSDRGLARLVLEHHNAVDVVLETRVTPEHLR